MEYNTNYGRFGIPEIVCDGYFDRSKEAWILSKPNIHYEGLDDPRLSDDMGKLIQMNLPIADQIVYHLQFYTSIYYRDLVMMMPHVIPWSQSTRNLEMHSEEGRKIYQISLEVMGLPVARKHKEMLEECRRRSEAGEALDIVKKSLPVTTMMAYSLSMSRRTLLTHVKTLEDLDPQLYELYGRELLDAVGISEYDYRSTKVSGILPSLKIDDDDLLYFAYRDRGSRVEFCRGKAFHTVKANFSVCAQFLRQHFSDRKYYEFNRIAEHGYFSPECLDKTLNDRTIIMAEGSRQAYERTISRRSCWFADFDVNDPNVDSWALILDDAVKDMDEAGFVKNLPCQGCADKCDIYEEFKHRAMRKEDGNLQDRNTLCPILLERIEKELGVKKTVEEVIEERQKSQHSNSLVFNKWKSIELNTPSRRV